MDIIRKDFRKYVNNHYMTRKNVVPYYIDLIMSGVDPMGLDVKRVNELILSKWTMSGLLYIKERAWKEVMKFHNQTKKGIVDFNPKANL